MVRKLLNIALKSMEWYILSRNRTQQASSVKEENGIIEESRKSIHSKLDRNQDVTFDMNENARDKQSYNSTS